MKRWGGRWSQRLVALVLFHFGRACHLCGYDGAGSADHLIPRGQGGPDTLDNLRPAHLICNQRRNDRPLEPALFVELRGRYEADVAMLTEPAPVSPRFAAAVARSLRTHPAFTEGSPSPLSIGIPAKKEDRP